MVNMERLHLSVADEARVNKMRKESLIRIKNHPSISAWIDENALTDEEILQNASKFLRVIEENEKCLSCPGIGKCAKSLRGIVPVLQYDGERIELVLRPGEENKKRIRLDSSFLIRDFPDEYLKYDLKDAMNSDYIDARKVVLAALNEIGRKNSEKGIFLHGSRQSGKTFILSLFAKKYAEKKDKTVAFLDSSVRIRMLNDLYFQNREEFLSQLAEISAADLLILDDFGNEYKNEIVRDVIVYPLLNERFRSGKLTCFTSSYDLSKIETMYALREKGSPKAQQLRELIETMTRSVELRSLPYRE